MPHRKVFGVQPQRDPVQFHRAKLHFALQRFAERLGDPIAETRLELLKADHDPDAGNDDDGNQDADDDAGALSHSLCVRQGTIEIWPSRSSVACRTSSILSRPCESRAASFTSS